MNVNKVMIVGRLTRDPEVRTTTSGQSVTNISVATSYTWKDQSGQQQQKTEFHNVVAWARRGEVIAQYFVKGQEIFVEGRLETRSWDDTDSGKKMYRTEIILDNFEFGAKPNNSNQAYDNNYSAQSTQSTQQPASNPVQQSNTQQPIQNEIPTIDLNKSQEVKIEDVPF